MILYEVAWCRGQDKTRKKLIEYKGPYTDDAGEPLNKMTEELLTIVKNWEKHMGAGKNSTLQEKPKTE